MQTKYTLTTKEIQKAIYDLYKTKGYKYFSLNTFGQGIFEADFLAIHPKEDFCVEFEIKRSKADFQADFKKKNKHELLKSGKWISNQFYFVCERGLLDAKQIPYHLGLITVEKLPVYKTIISGQRVKRKREYIYDVAVIKKAKVLHNRQFPKKLLLKILTSVMTRFFENFGK